MTQVHVRLRTVSAAVFLPPPRGNNLNCIPITLSCKKKRISAKLSGEMCNFLGRFGNKTRRQNIILVLYWLTKKIVPSHTKETITVEIWEECWCTHFQPSVFKKKKLQVLPVRFFFVYSPLRFYLSKVWPEFHLCTTEQRIVDKRHSQVN